MAAKWLKLVSHQDMEKMEQNVQHFVQLTVMLVTLFVLDCMMQMDAKCKILVYPRHTMRMEIHAPLIAPPIVLLGNVG